MPKWVYPLLLVFTIFFILTAPTTAGGSARDFFSWVGDQAASVSTFLDELFSGDATDPSGPSTDNTGSSATDGTTTNNTGDTGSVNEADTFDTMSDYPLLT